MSRHTLQGRVYLVGAGPGAPDLITLRGAEVLKRADIVFHDALVHADTLALAAAARHVPVGKRCGARSAAQHFINKQLVDAAARYATVVRLKGGDPTLFARAHEEITALRAAGIEVEIVPGVTAACAAAAELNLSLTQRGVARSVVFATPRVGRGEQANDWMRGVLAADTAVLYMAAGEAAAIAADLLAAGLPPQTPAAVIENATLPEARQAFGRLAELPLLASRLSGGPALIVLGDVLNAAEREAALEPLLRAAQ